MNYLARFQIVQDRHVSGEMGEVVAEGVRFNNGWVSVHWYAMQIPLWYKDMTDLYNQGQYDRVSMALHWIDPPPPGTPNVNDTSTE